MCSQKEDLALSQKKILHTIGYRGQQLTGSQFIDPIEYCNAWIDGISTP